MVALGDWAQNVVTFKRWMPRVRWNLWVRFINARTLSLTLFVGSPLRAWYTSSVRQCGSAGRRYQIVRKKANLGLRKSAQCVH